MGVSPAVQNSFSRIMAGANARPVPAALPRTAGGRAARDPRKLGWVLPFFGCDFSARGIRGGAPGENRISGNSREPFPELAPKLLNHGPHDAQRTGRPPRFGRSL